jgi:hypothetical protein
VQYFADLSTLMERLFHYLGTQGEIHILDSPFYSDRSLDAARERTRLYYEKMGFLPMAAYYYHHRFSELERYGPATLYDPKAIRSRLGRFFFGQDLSPFPWIRLKKDR